MASRGKKSVSGSDVTRVNQYTENPLVLCIICIKINYVLIRVVLWVVLSGSRTTYYRVQVSPGARTRMRDQSVYSLCGRTAPGSLFNAARIDVVRPFLSNLEHLHADFR